MTHYVILEIDHNANLCVATKELTTPEVHELERPSTDFRAPVLVSASEANGGGDKLGAPIIPMVLHAPVGESLELSLAELSSETWGIRATAADRSQFTGQGVTVAVLDTGIDSSHPAFDGVEIVEKDFTGEGNGDAHGHGTHCAGTIFGRTVDGKRIGVAPGIEKALIGKVLGGTGRTPSDSVYRGINWALDKGANVISMSLGIDFPGYVQQLMDEGIPEKAAISMGLEAYRTNVQLFSAIANFVKTRAKAGHQPTLIIAAAGNDSARNRPHGYEISVASPAAADDILAVGALGRTSDGLKIADFSNTNPDFCGPGVGIESAQAGGGYVSLNGTSMATPHVVGIAALWAEQMLKTAGQINLRRLVGRLGVSGTYDGFAPGYKEADVGSGMVQAPLE